MRTHYRNGDEIGLVHTGCDGCSPSMINGVLCHETGCPDRWRDEEGEDDWDDIEQEIDWNGWLLMEEDL